MAKKKPEKPPQAKDAWNQTEASKTTMGKLAALADAYDELDLKANSLKGSLSEVKGQILEHKIEIRKVAREGKTPTDLKSLAGLERDVERWEIKQAQLSEQRSAAKAARKEAMDDILKTIREGPGLFEAQKEQEPDPPAGKASPRSAREIGEKIERGEIKPSPPSKSAADPAASSPPSPKVGKKYRITEKETGERIDRTVKVVRINPNNQRVVIADPETGRSQKEIDPGAFAWDPA